MEVDEKPEDCTISQDGAGIPQDGAISRARRRASLPFHSRPFHSVQGGNAKGGSADAPPAVKNELSVVPSDDSFEPELFENLIGLFVALGRGLGISDRIRCENCWKGLSAEERHKAHDFAMSQRQDWQTRPTGKIAQPWNFLAEKHWERDRAEAIGSDAPAVAC